MSETKNTQTTGPSAPHLIAEVRAPTTEGRANSTQADRGTHQLWSSPLVLAISGAVLALLSNVAVTLINAQESRTLEAMKAEHARILAAIQSPSPNQNAENLSFLLESGLVSNPETAAKIRSFLLQRKPNTGPALSGSVQIDGVGASGGIAGAKE